MIIERGAIMSQKITWHELKETQADGLRVILGHVCVPNKCHVALVELRDGSWDVMRIVNDYGACSSPMATCKTLTSAKRWVSRYYLKEVAL